MPVVFALAALGALVALVVAPLYLDRFRRELSRAEQMERIATALGLQFSRMDPAYPGSTALRHPFELFSRGVEQTCENFISGTIGGVDVVAFDFLYRQRTEADAAPQRCANGARPLQLCNRHCQRPASAHRHRAPGDGFGRARRRRAGASMKRCVFH